MRIRNLEIEQFGVFVNHEIEFSSDSLDVVYGPNEAGKSTLLQLIRELLFGFPVRNPYVFPEHTGEMAAVATLELVDGARVRFRRRKGRRDEVVGQHLDDGTEIDAPALNRLLGGASAELFQNVFGFSLSELAAGQLSLERAKLSEALYGGALGGLANFRKVLDGLETEHEALYVPAATKRPINQLLSELRRQGKELRAAQIRPRDYDRLAGEVRELRERVEQLREDRDALQRQQLRCAQLSQAVALWHRRTMLFGELNELEIPREFPRDGARQFAHIRSLCDQVASELGEFRQELEDVTTQLATLSPQADLIDKAGKIQQLAQQLDMIRGYHRDIALRQQESQAVRAAVLAKLRELDPSWTLEHLNRFQASIASRTSITAMQEELDELRQRQRDLLAQRPGLQADVADVSRQLGALPDEHIASELIELFESATEYEARLEKLEQYQEQRRELQSRMEAMQRKLNSPFASELGCDELARLPVPMTATVAEFRQAHGELSASFEHCTLRLQRARVEVEHRQQELDALHSEDQVPDREALDRARAQRDHGWELVRRRYIDESMSDDELGAGIADDSKPLPEAYEQSVRDADQLADQRQQHAEVVARLEQLGREVAKSQRLCREEELEESNCRDAIETWQRRWCGLWEPGGISPKEPDAMLDWLRIHGELVDTVGEIDALKGHEDAQRQWTAQYEVRLRSMLEDVSGAPAARVSEVRRRVQQARDAAALRNSYAAQLPRKQQQLTTLEQELTDLADRTEQWQKRWQPLMEEFGFPSAWEVHTATQVLSGLSEARTQQREAESLDRRVHDMQEGLDRFERDISTLCRAIAPQLNERPAVNAVEELVQMLDQTRRQLQDEQSLLQQRAKLESRCEAKQNQLQKEQAVLRSLLDQAGVQNEDELPEIIRRVQRWYDMHDELEAVEHQLRAIRGGEDQAEFEAALSDADEAELESRQRILSTELERVDQRFNEALRAQGVAAQRVEEMDQASQAAALAQELESTRSRLAETVDRWAPLVLARTFMVRAMERFQREHQPKLLVDVSRLLKQMTLGQYTEISRKLDEHGSLQVHQADGRVKEPHQLSTGTREQLYLAIRLAYVLHYCREAEPLPIVMDDVLVNFDDQRAAETLEALIAVSQHVQLILLTCHRHTVDLVRSRLPETQPILLGDAVIHEGAPLDPQMRLGF